MYSKILLWGLNMARSGVHLLSWYIVDKRKCKAMNLMPDFYVINSVLPCEIKEVMFFLIESFYVWKLVGIFVAENRKHE